MPYRKYTQCYEHKPGDKPFNEGDLFGFSAGAAAPGLGGALAAFLTGNVLIGVALTGISYAQAIIAVADEWLYHRLACIGPGSNVKCAVGRVISDPEVGGLGEFDNDQFFDVMLMPHRDQDDYLTYNYNYNKTPPGPGPSGDGKTEDWPANDIYNDHFQGQKLMKPFFTDLPYKLDRTKLHCEAEGNFWVKMKEWALIAGAVVAVASAAGAAAGASLGCAIGGFFGPLGCAIGAIIGAIIGWALGAGAGHMIVSAIAFDADPGEVEDSNVGDKALGPIVTGDHVVVYGEHVYDGYHEGWHEFHPLMAVVKLNSAESSQYLEWEPDFAVPKKPPAEAQGMPGDIKGLSELEMRIGLESPKFRKRAEWLRDKWCLMLAEAFDDATRELQRRPAHRWTIHPWVDGCVEIEGGSVPAGGGAPAKPKPPPDNIK